VTIQTGYKFFWVKEKKKSGGISPTSVCGTISSWSLLSIPEEGLNNENLFLKIQCSFWCGSCIFTVSSSKVFGTGVVWKSTQNKKVSFAL